MSEERTSYNANQQVTCKTCGYEIVRQGQFWRHIEGPDPAGYFGPDGFWVICGKPEPAAQQDRLYTLAEIERGMIAVDDKLTLEDEPITADRWRAMILDELRKL